MMQWLAYFGVGLCDNNRAPAKRSDDHNDTDTVSVLATTRARWTASSDVDVPGRTTATHFEASKC